jgi:hypothetical protein
MSAQFSINDVLADEADNPWRGDIPRALKCPVCGDTYQHIGKEVGPPQLMDGENAYAADWWGKGDLIVIPVAGECGHKWEICFGFHKGDTAVFARTLD